MKAKRLWWTVRTAFTVGGKKRAQYAKRNNIYGGIVENVSIQSRVIPIYSELIKFHNNIAVSRNVDFCTHDIIKRVLNRLQENNTEFKEHIGCIEVMDNVFIGSNSVILYGVQIGPNVIVAYGSVVVKDCEPNSVYAGVPAKKVAQFSDFVEKRRSGETSGLISTTVHNQSLTEQEIIEAWKAFEKIHQ